MGLLRLVRGRWRRLEDHLQPGRGRVLLVLLALMAASGAAAVLLHGTARIVAGVAFLATFIVGGFMANWVLEPREKVYSAVYTGSYPPLPREDRVDLWVTPEGLHLSFRKHRRVEVVRHGLIQGARVDTAGQGGVLNMTIADRITRTVYPASLVFGDLRTADDVFDALARQRYVQADALWAAWRTINLRLPISDEELRQGFRKVVPFTRMVACPRCGGVEGADRSCPVCAGRGYRTEKDIVEVVARPGTPPDKKFVFDGAGNEDPNGRRGPVVVRLTKREPLELEPWPERDPEHENV